MDRQIALDILLKYKQEQSYLNLTLNTYFQNQSLLKEQKDLITNIVYGTVQNQLYLEYMLEPFLHTRVKTYEKMLLLMSLYQHYFLNSIPDYAIVNEAVNMAKKKKGKKTADFINAVLKQAFLSQRSLDELNIEEKLSIETSHPLWMIKMFIKQYGLDVTRKICEADNKAPYKTARVNTLKTTKDILLNDSLFEVGKLGFNCLYYHGGNLANTSYFHDGLITIQDESSQLVAEFLNPLPHD
ncbi:MAG: transcription antitermination factor NusB, partial [Coprobacillus sp.]